MPPLNLLTPTALAVGQSFAASNGITVRVNSSVPGGFSISVFPTPIPNPAMDMSYLVPLLL
jgi:hypothetical protein